MAHQFSKHYTLDEARALLPQVRRWLDQMSDIRSRLADLDERIGAITGAGSDAGGRIVNEWICLLADLKSLLREFEAREIQIKDLDRGLIDFPAFIGGREVFLCWEKDEDDIEFWHDLATGYAGRQHL